MIVIKLIIALTATVAAGLLCMFLINHLDILPYLKGYIGGAAVVILGNLFRDVIVEPDN